MIKSKKINYTKINKIKKDFKKDLIEQRNNLADEINKILMVNKIIEKPLNFGKPKHFRQNYLKIINPKIEKVVIEFRVGENTVINNIKDVKKQEKDIKKQITKDKIKKSQKEKKLQEIEIKLEDLKKRIKEKEQELVHLKRTIEEIKRKIKKRISKIEANTRSAKNLLGRREFALLRLTNVYDDLKMWKKEIGFLSKEINNFNGYNKKIKKTCEKI